MKNHKNHKMDIHLNLNVRGMLPSATLFINERSDELMRQGKSIIKLGLGQSPFPVPEPVVEELRMNAHQKDYLPVKGLRSLRRAVANYHNRAQGLNHNEEDVLIGPGSKELMFLLQFVYYGDLVIPTPSWVSYAPQAHLIGRHVRWVPTLLENGWRLTPEELSNLCKNDPDRPRIVILNYPSNPSGRTYQIEVLKALAKVARRHKVILLSDEIYGELHHKGRHISIARFYPEGTIISGGLSKWCGAGGWRLGTFTFPQSLRWLLDAMAAVASETYTSTSAPIQYAAVRAFEGGIEIEKYLRESRRILKALGKFSAKKLAKIGVEVPLPEGAFYLFPDFGKFKEKLKQRGITTSEGFTDRLLEETGVAILSGSSFGRSPEELTARIAYVDFSGAKALEAAGKIPPMTDLNDRFIEAYCPKIFTGIEKICNWLSK